MDFFQKAHQARWMLFDGPADSDGEAAKQAALDHLEARRATYILRGRRALLEQLLQYGCGTLDQVRAVVELPAAIGPKLFGCLPRELLQQRIIRSDGFVLSQRPEAHGRPIRLWQLVDRAAALAWLASHPEDPAL
jgi:hypothetical protein